MARAFDCAGELPLVLRAGPCHTPGDNFGALAQIPSQAGNVLIIDIVDLIDTKRAYFFSAFSSTGWTAFPVILSFHDNTSFSV